MDSHTRLTLLLARVLITDPHCWTVGVLARSRIGGPVSPLDDSAVAWCARGAVYRVVGGDVEAFQRAVRYLDRASQALYGTSICAVNDGPSALAHAAVLGAFDHAVDELGLARPAYALAASSSDENLDALEILGPTPSSVRQTARVHLTDIGPTETVAPTLVEKESAATVRART